MAETPPGVDPSVNRPLTGVTHTHTHIFHRSHTHTALSPLTHTHIFHRSHTHTSFTAHTHTQRFTWLPAQLSGEVDAESYVLLGMKGRRLEFTPVDILGVEADFK